MSWNKRMLPCCVGLYPRLSHPCVWLTKAPPPELRSPPPPTPPVFLIWNMTTSLTNRCSCRRYRLYCSHQSRVLPIWSQMQPHFSIVRLKKILGHTSLTNCSSTNKKKPRQLWRSPCGQQQTRIMPLSWSEPIRDSQGFESADGQRGE